MNAIELRLLNEFQRDFPLRAEPFREIGARLGVADGWVLARLEALQRQGIVSRVGAVFAPGAVGASTLAALAAPEARLNEVARTVSAHAEVNHNYEREHRFNLWFVVNAPDRRALAAVLAAVERETRCAPVISMPLVEEYHIDLGFDLAGAAQRREPRLRRPAAARLSAAEKRLLAGLQDGLQLVQRPFRALGEACGSSEQAVIATLARWLAEGIVRRLGVIVRHHELGFVANAMVVWDVPDECVTDAGLRLAQVQGVTLCYRRERAAPQWRYNFYCMIHGRDRAEVLATIASLGQRCGLSPYPMEILFSRQRFKQRGALHFAGMEASSA